MNVENMHCLKGSHFITWQCQLATLQQLPYFSPISTLLADSYWVSGQEKCQMIQVGLAECCHCLTVLPLSSFADLAYPNVRRQIKKQLIKVLADTQQKQVVLDLFNVSLMDEAVKQAVQDILVTLGNEQYGLAQAGYKSAAKPLFVEWDIFTSARGCHRIDETYQQARAICDGMLLARRLADKPSQDCTPKGLVAYLHDYCQQHTDIGLQVLDSQQLQQQGLGVLYAVGKGSTNLPYLAVLSYQGGETDQAPYVFVGKGITFDSGGLWLKSGEGMSTMKYDMAGAAVLIGLLDTVRRLQLPLNIHIVLALAENMISPTAMRPGDVVTSYNGLTVEINNTDAEGRLALADALSYSEKQFNPAYLIDIATLTGAVVKALGYDITGMMGNDSDLLAAMTQAGQQTQDRVWALPLDESFASQVKSTIADVTNTPPNNAAIAVSAAYFLSRFCQDSRWVHLDISGTSLDRRGYTQASGRPLPLLIQFLVNQVTK